MTTTEVESRLTALEAQVARLQEELEKTRITARIRRGLDQADHGQTLPARQALDALRQKYNITSI